MKFTNGVKCIVLVLLLSIIKQSRSLASLYQEHHRIYRVFTNYPSLPGLEGGNKAHPGVSHYLRLSPSKGQEADITSKGNISLPLLLSPSLQNPCLQPPTGPKVVAIPRWGHRAGLMPSEVSQLQQVTNLYPFGIPLPRGLPSRTRGLLHTFQLEACGQGAPPALWEYRRRIGLFSFCKKKKSHFGGRARTLGSI